MFRRSSITLLWTLFVGAAVYSGFAVKKSKERFENAHAAYLMILKQDSQLGFDARQSSRPKTSALWNWGSR